MISNIWVINKNNSLCVLQRNYGAVNKIDKDLFSGFVTAFFNFSEEISGEHIKSVTMGSFKFFYKNTETMILTLTADPNLGEDDITPIMEHIITEFVNQGYEEKLNQGVLKETIFEPFIKTLDEIVLNAINNLQEVVVNRQSQSKIAITSAKPIPKRDIPLLEVVKFERTKILTDQDAQVIKENIIETLENAEYAISYSEFKEASIFYGVAAGLFEELGDLEKAQTFRQFANKLKDMAVYKEELLAQEAADKAHISETMLETAIPTEVIPILDFESIQDEKIKDILIKAFKAEVAKRYQEAITYYNSAAGLFLINKMPLNADKCSEKIKELVKKQQLEPQPVIPPSNETTAEYIEEPNIPPESTVKTKSELIIPEREISDEGIKNLLKNAVLAENIELYYKAINFYHEAYEKFISYKDLKNQKICAEKINDLNKKLPSEQRIELEKEKEEEETLLISVNSIPNEEIKNLLKNATIAENLKLYDRAIKFYSEAADKYAALKDSKNEIECKTKIADLSKKVKIEERLEKFKPIIPLESIEDAKIKKNLQRAYEAELNKKFKQASLYYNIVTGLFSAKNDQKNAELCSKTAKKLMDLS
ncbi:MAG: hypothetical protein ACTSO9_09780 [Candidatus Helarchaeota archaeon]